MRFQGIKQRRVVITGIGALTPIGNTFKSSWESLINGISGVDIHEDSSGEKRFSARLKGFNAELYLSKKEIIRTSPFVQYALSASLMAVEDAGLSMNALKKAGVITGTSRAGISSMEQAILRKTTGDGRVSAYLMPSTTPVMASSYTAERLGIEGRVLCVSNSCASGLVAIGEAFELVKSGSVDIALAGGTEAPLCGISFEGYGAMHALSKAGIVRPFDKKRDGFVLGEGAAMLVIEEYASAIKRGAGIYAEIIGYALMSIASNETRPDVRGQATTIQSAIKGSGINTDEIDYINAHATSTAVGDEVEARAISKIFGKRSVPVSANKSMTGHMLGASSAFETAGTAMSIKTGLIPPTINVDKHIEGINLIRELGEINPRIALTNSFGLGGINSVLLLKAVL